MNGEDDECNCFICVGRRLKQREEREKAQDIHDKLRDLGSIARYGRRQEED